MCYAVFCLQLQDILRITRNWQSAGDNEKTFHTGRKAGGGCDMLELMRVDRAK